MLSGDFFLLLLTSIVVKLFLSARLRIEFLRQPGRDLVRGQLEYLELYLFHLTTVCSYVANDISTIKPSYPQLARGSND